MKLGDLHPVVLCGGSGSRLWPLSRTSYPKQLLNLVDDNLSLLQSTLLRASKLPGAQNPILVCNTDHRFLVGEQCKAIKSQTNQLPAAIYLEPVSRNTAPAIALAALHLAEDPIQPNPDAVMLVLPADHIIQNQDAFHTAVDQATTAAQEGWLVTFGIKPNKAETGYGYIRGNQKFSDSSISLPKGVFAVEQFVEKPDIETAKRYFLEGSYYWNSGMFVFTARSYLQQLAQYRPDILDAVRQAWQKSEIDMDFFRPEEMAFAHCPSESIDYALMQKTKHAAVVEVDSLGWSDIGSWDSLWETLPKDGQGNSVRGDVFVAQSNNNLIFASNRQVTAIGLNDVVIVETSDAVLVISKSESQRVKLAIENFSKSGRNEHIDHLRVHRPWGWYESTDRGERFKVKRLMVKPGHQLSLQMHHHRAEHWVVVSGTAQVTLGQKQIILCENQSTYIPLGEVHRLHNPGKVPLQIVEVQSGTYLEEDDIIRFDDDYTRH
jgi:mannose-1-phosphate guanylyltransferase/mannose-1-phosphate guanylyltransferase/mannose-6-phosphate isomerase